jgi:hypothetical protein
VRQVVLFGVVFLAVAVIGFATLPYAEWSESLVSGLSLILAFVVVEVAYRRWWQPKE